MGFLDKTIEGVKNITSKVTEPKDDRHSSRRARRTAPSTKTNTKKNRNFTDAGRLAQDIYARDAIQKRQDQANTNGPESSGDPPPSEARTIGQGRGNS